MNLYQEITRRNRLKPEANANSESKSPAEEALKSQQIVDWINHPHSQEIFEELANEIEKLEQHARDESCNLIESPRQYIITNKLIRATELRKIIDKYGKIS